MEHWVQDSRPCTKWSHCWEFAFSTSKIECKEINPFLGMRKNGTPWIRTLDKFPIEFSWEWKLTYKSMEYETELPYPLTTLKCSWGNITGPKFWSKKKNCWSKGLNNLGQTKPTLLYPTALSLGSQLKVELVKNNRIKISKQ